jgi:hypothetical protein
MQGRRDPRGGRNPGSINKRIAFFIYKIAYTFTPFEDGNSSHDLPALWLVLSIICIFQNLNRSYEKWRLSCPVSIDVVRT